MAEVTNDHIKGIVLIFIVAVIWITASFIVQSIEGELHPVLLTFFCNTLFLIYFPLSILQHRRSTATKDRVTSPSVVALRQQGQLEAAGSPIARVTSAATRPPHTAAEVESLDVEGSSLQPADTGTESSAVTSSNLLQPAPRWTVLKAAAAVAPLWFLAQLCFNVSLKMTSVTSNTILSSPASLFTFFMSVLVLGEKFSVAKLVAVLLTVAGTVLVALADNISSAQHLGESNGVLGDALTLAAAALYACYTITLKQMMPSENEGDMMLFFGYLGAINIALFGPVVVVMQMAGTFNMWALSWRVIALAFIKGLFDNALADYLWSRAVLLVGPTVATVGMSLQVPIAMIVDPLVHVSGWWSTRSVCLLELLGATAILGGFFTINSETAKSE